MKNKLPLPNNLKARYERKTNLYRVFLFLLICFSFSFNAKADVISTTVSLNAALVVAGDLTITSTGIIQKGTAATIDITVHGNLIMEVGALIRGDVSAASATGTAINIIVDGTVLLKGNGIPSGTSGSNGAKITSNQNAGSCTGGHGGAITITASGITTQTGSVISANAKCSAGRIIMTATVDSVLIQGLVQSKSSLSGTGGNQQPGGGPIYIYSICSLRVDDLGVVSSEGSDPGADLVHLEACSVTIYGLVQSTGAGHVSPAGTDILLYRTDAHHPANATAAVEMWAHDLVIDRTNGHKGEVNANLSVGASKRSWIDLFADSTITILGPASIPATTLFAVHANNGGNQPTGGQITAQTALSIIKMRGNAIQANTGSGGTGGVIQVFAKTDFDLMNNETGGRIEAKGNAKGGDFNAQSEAGGILSDPNTIVAVNVGTAAASVLLTGCTTVTPPSVLPVTVSPVITFACIPNPEFEPYVNLPSGCASSPQNPPTCRDCSGSDIIVNQNVTINFNTATPTYTGDPDLAPFFSFSKVGTAPNLWVAKFDLDNHKLIVKSGATITTSQVNGAAPGINITGKCDLEVENGGHIVVKSSNNNAGDILIQINGNYIINGEIRDEIIGTQGLPGCITMVSKCGSMDVGQTGLIQDLGRDFGGCGVTLLTCGSTTTTTTDCAGNTTTTSGVGGDITISGLVKSYAPAHAGDLNLHRPNITVISLDGAVTIIANTPNPLYINSGGLDIWAGLLAWVPNNVKPGTIWVQAKKDVNVLGHGTFSTRRSVGGISSIGTASDVPGGIIDVRSIEGSINASDRSFDVKGRNRLVTNFAHISLFAKLNISLNRLGINNNFSPVVDASGFGAGDKGGINDIRSFTGSVNVGLNAIVTAAAVTPGVNNITYCSTFNNLGTVTPAPVLSVACSPDAPTALFPDCSSIPGGIFRAAESTLSNSQTFGTTFYPNPTNGFATVRFTSDASAQYTINVVDLTGRVVYTEVVSATEGENVHQLDFTNLAKGMYIMGVANGSVKDQLRILVQ